MEIKILGDGPLYWVSVILRGEKILADDFLKVWRAETRRIHNKATSFHPGKEVTENCFASFC